MENGMQNGDERNKILVSPKVFFWNLLLMAVGGTLCALSINGIMIPQRFVTGGMTGLALIIHEGVPSLHIGAIYVLLNIPLFLVAWISVGRRFFVFSVLGLVILALALFFVRYEFEVHDKILSALLAGILSGAGAGVTLRSLGSSGGLDILSVILMRRFSVGIGNTIMAVNALVLVLVTFLYSIEAVLYTLVVIYVSSKVLNLVVTGFSQRKAIFIISKKWDEISREILRDIRRGVTVIKGEGGYSKKEERILYTVISFRDLGHLKRLITRIDEDAFVVVSDTLEVMNNRIGNQPHW